MQARMKQKHADAAGPPTSGISRRQDVRLDPPPNLKVTVPTTTARLAIKDISTGGVCLIGDAPLPPQSVHTVTLTLGRMVVTRRARAVHAEKDSRGRWLTGMQFLNESNGSSGSIEDLVNLVLSSSISFS